MNPNITEGNVTFQDFANQAPEGDCSPADCSLSWFWCNAHKESHTGNHCPEGTRETCLDVGPYSTKEEADDFPENANSHLPT